MTITQHRAWLCKQCNERVDPTMSMCWQCGHDRLGVPAQDLQADIETELTLRQDHQTALTHAMKQWSVLLRLVLLSWCITFFFIMITGTAALNPASVRRRGPIDELVVVLFYASIFFTFMLIAHRLVYNGESESLVEGQRSSDLHRPWIRRWMVRGWGSLLFWFAWGWVLLNYI